MVHRIDSGAFRPLRDGSPEAVIDAIGEYPDGADEMHATYSLVCDPPAFEDAMERAEDLLPEVPYWIEEAAAATNLGYVGYSSSPIHRILTHCQGDGAWFTKVFEPVAIHNVQWFPRKQDAQYWEREGAKLLRIEFAKIGQSSETFIYQA